MNASVQRIERTLAQSRRAAFVTLWIALIAQVIWTVYDVIHAHPPVGDILYPLIFVPAAGLLAATQGRVRWVAVIPRLLIAASFLDNVADRLGLLGPPGAPNVSWGDFQHFIAYTAQVNAFAPRALIPALAVMATIGEGTLGLGMLLGVRTRLSAAGSAGLLVVFATAMVLSGLSQFQYNVYLMAAAAWALAAIGKDGRKKDGSEENGSEKDGSRKDGNTRDEGTRDGNRKGRDLAHHAFTIPIFLVSLFSASVARGQGASGAASGDTLQIPRAAPADVASLDAIIHALYGVISGPAGPRDWRRFRSLFAPGARLIPTIRDSSGHTRVLAMSPDQYAEQGAPEFQRAPFYEDEIGRTVETFGAITQVFTAYASRQTPTGKPFARGINSMQFFNDGTRWYCVTIYWDEERPGTAIPERYLRR